jgi:hypothetical protein
MQGKNVLYCGEDSRVLELVTNLAKSAVFVHRKGRKDLNYINEENKCIEFEECLL